MIRPELIVVMRRWAEPALAVAGTLIALWIVGATNLRWGWLSLILAAIILISGGLWTREAIRRVRFSTGDAGGAGRVFVEEGRILYVGSIGNIQVELADITRIDIAVSKTRLAKAHIGLVSDSGEHVAPKPSGQTWASVLLYTPGGTPAAVPLNAEGHDAFIDALCTLPGFRFDALNAAILKQRAAGGHPPIVTFWRRNT